MSDQGATTWVSIVVYIHKCVNIPCGVDRSSSRVASVWSVWMFKISIGVKSHQSLPPVIHALYWARISLIMSTQLDGTRSYTTNGSIHNPQVKRKRSHTRDLSPPLTPLSPSHLHKRHEALPSFNPFDTEVTKLHFDLSIIVPIFLSIDGSIGWFIISCFFRSNGVLIIKLFSLTTSILSFRF